MSTWSVNNVQLNSKTQDGVKSASSGYGAKSVIVTSDAIEALSFGNSSEIAHIYRILGSCTQMQKKSKCD